jgi:hypothetical protein
MITFDAIAPDGTRERLRFETQDQADAAADRYRDTGHKVHELLGRVAAGSTARFVQDGTLPGDTRQCAAVYRLAS